MPLLHRCKGEQGGTAPLGTTSKCAAAITGLLDCPRLCASRHSSNGARRRRGAACVDDAAATPPTPAHRSSRRRSTALLLPPSMNEGPLSSPLCASAGRSVSARGGRPPARMLAESRPDGVLASLRGADGVVVSSGAHLSIASSTSRTRCDRCSLRWRISKQVIGSRPSRGSARTPPEVRRVVRA